MGDSKFFTNHSGNTLFDKFKGIREGMISLHSFHAVVGYFRSSGYFKIRQELGDIQKVQILVGINIDNIFRSHNKSLLFMASNNNGDKIHDEAMETYKRDFIKDVKDAGYYKDIENGILLLAEDIQNGRVELKIHATKDLHAKFYLFLPEKHTKHSDGWVIMGSSNLSNSGLGLTEPPRYELNVSMKDFDDVAFCKEEFDKLWKDGLPLTFDDIEQFRNETHLGQTPTPYELYMKVLIDFFQGQVEDDFSLEMPDGVMKLKYQTDAVGQGYEMLKKHNGFFLADVVGLGKTVVATMVAKRFIEENGIRETKILVIYPPALASNWKDTFEKFKIAKNTDFLSCGSLDRVLEGTHNYRNAEEYDMILVDEAHRFRGDSSAMYDKLQRICKADREYEGRVGGRKKKVMLISATPLNNRPDDLYNLLMLFQDKRNSTIDGQNNLQDYFAPKIAAYKLLMSSKNESINVEDVDKIYNEIRTDIIDKITVRRTRENIMRNPDYVKDLQEQKIKFPEIEKPREVGYILPPDLKTLFENTMLTLTEGLKYARYKAIENLTAEYKSRYPNAEATSRSLATIYRTHMVKRLESSFEAFRKSLGNLRRVTQGMIDMLEADKVIIAPDLKVKELQDKGIELDEIIERGIEKFGIEKEDFVYPKFAFKPEFIEDLKFDIVTLDNLIVQWSKVSVDPKLDRFVEYLQSQIFNKKENPTGKLVVFSESKDTIAYLERELKTRLGRKDILSVSSDDRKQQFATIQTNFNANHKTKKDDYNIIISTDVLAEGVNLHRANVIVNYDTPWNASRLMQRIGRVNRIGSVAGVIVNYMFYPSAEGDAQIRLYKNALAKLQGFHSAYGEDSQIYSHEEIVQQFELFNPNVGDDVDRSLAFLREVREFRAANPEDYERIKELPFKSRTGRETARANKRGIKPNTSLVYIASPFKQEFYLVDDGGARDIGFLEAAELFKAAQEEESAGLNDAHYRQVAAAQTKFDRDITAMMDDNTSTASDRDTPTDAARSLLKKMKRDCPNTKNVTNCDILMKYVELGTYVQLTRELQRLERKLNRTEDTTLEEVEIKLKGFVAKYHKIRSAKIVEVEDTTPQIVLSETFV
ncbi:MAG: helicase [Parabacteroides sp.]|jgi:superfamily II DNA/RNA helicase|nr:helicase [Bacteroidales bacterium]MBP9578544.1 helicase [Parabacteroides sp.]